MLPPSPPLSRSTAPSLPLSSPRTCSSPHLISSLHTLRLPRSPNESASYLDLQRESPYAAETASESVYHSDTESLSEASYIREEDNRKPREFTISPDKKGEDSEPPLEVEHQRSFTGRYAIPSSLADKKCHTFWVQGLLDKLNDIMGTVRPLLPSLEFHLNRCLSFDYDFGLAYNYLRPHWRSDFRTLKATAESNDAIRRRDALDLSKKYITDPELPPRRIWNLYSNRVIPYYWRGGDLRGCLPVPHSWVADTERTGVLTSINGPRMAHL